jgi:hypothetical protein
MTKKRLLKLAQEKGIEIKKNNISKAKPLGKICGNLKSEYFITSEEALCRG